MRVSCEFETMCKMAIESFVPVSEMTYQTSEANLVRPCKDDD